MRNFLLFRRRLLVVLFLPFIVHAEGGDDGPTTNVPLNEVSVRAYRFFHKEWSSVADEAWFKTDKELFAVFSDHSHRKKVFFNLKGVFLYSLEYYAGKDIAAELGAMVRNKYPNYQIKVVTEVSTLEKTAFFITIENSSSVKRLSIVNGKMEVLEDLINGDSSGSILAQN